MAMSVNPINEGSLSDVMGQCDPAAMIRSRSTVPIRACGQGVPRQQAGHMTASCRLSRRAKKTLLAGGHPHMTAFGGSETTGRGNTGEQEGTILSYVVTTSRCAGGGIYG